MFDILLQFVLTVLIKMNDFNKFVLIPAFEYENLRKKQSVKKDKVSIGDKLENVLQNDLLSDKEKIDDILHEINMFLKIDQESSEKLQRDIQNEKDIWDNDVEDIVESDEETSAKNDAEAKKTEEKAAAEEKNSEKQKKNSCDPDLEPPNACSSLDMDETEVPPTEEEPSKEQKKKIPEKTLPLKRPKRQPKKTLKNISQDWIFY